MDKVKVAILDSGFDFCHKLQNEIVYNTNFIEAESISDSNGHGTCIVCLIDSIDNNLQIYNMKVLDSKKKGRLSGLKSALREALKQRVDIINLSLGFEQPINDTELNQILLECQESNIIIVATNPNDERINYLHNNRDILYVQGKMEMTKGKIYFYDNTFYISNFPRIVPWLGKNYILSGANSFLTPFIIREISDLILQGKIDKRYIPLFLKMKLKYSGIEKFMKQQFDFNSISREDIINTKLFRWIYNAVNDLRLYDSTGEIIIGNINQQNITKLVKMIEEITGKVFIVNSIWLQDIKYLENLANRIEILRREYCGE